MKNVMKALFAVAVIAVVGLLGAVNAVAAESGACGQHAHYSLDDAGKLVISGTGSITQGSLDIKSWKENVKTLEIGSGITSICGCAFYGCEKLKTVSIPNTVTEIGGRAFFESGIESITLPDSVTFLGDGAFQHCYNLKTVTLSNNIKSIGYDVFDHCASIKSLVLPKNLKEIGAMNFCGCSMELTFTGSAPSFKEDGDKGFIFYNAEITKVYYPANDATWTKTVCDDLSINSSDIIWIPYTAANTDIQKFSDGKWYYTVNGKKDLKYTGFANNANGRYRIEKGVVNFKYTDVVKDENQWRYYSGGKFQTGTTSVVKRSNGTWWYVKNGVVQFNVTSVVKRTDNNTWWYVKNGQVQTGVTSVVKRTDNNTWWYVKNGQVQFGVTSVVKRTDNNTWWYVKGGQVQFGVTNIVKRADNNTWWYVNGGQVQTGVTSIIKRDDNNTWWYVKNGQVQFGVTSVEKRTDNGTWWYVKNGQVQFNVTNIVKRTEDGTWWYVKGSKVQTDKTGIVKRTDNNTWWYVKSGQVRFDYNGVIDGITIGTHKYELTLSNGKLVSGFPDETFAFDGNYVMSNGSVRYYIENKALYTQDAGSGKKTRLINLGSFFSSDTKMTLSYAYKNYVYLTYTDWDNEKVATYVFNTKNNSLKKIANDIAIVEYYGYYVVTYSGYLESEAISDISLYKINSNGSLSKMKTIAESGFAASCIDNKLFYLSVSYNDGAVWTMCSCNYDGTDARFHGSIPYYAYYEGNNTIDGYLIHQGENAYQSGITREQ
ncbi:MAG: leucine-rich repeat protein [Lachnospiraceae bacterium]|nr:leucine-rich repeat protein [Lachnospiraceae bacterium]